MSDITIVTTCRGRLEYAKQTVPHNASIAPVVFVDYGCPEKSGDWIKNTQNVEALEVPSKKWHHADARNRGLELVKTPWVAFVDADVFVHCDLSKLSPQTGTFYVAHHRHIVPMYVLDDWDALLDPSGGADLCGFILVETERARAVGGYDLQYVGWGAEDDDFRTALAFSGLKHGWMPEHSLSSITHDHWVRFGLKEDQDAEAYYKERLRNTKAQYQRKWSAKTPPFRPTSGGLINTKHT